MVAVGALLSAVMFSRTADGFRSSKARVRSVSPPTMVLV